MLDEYAILFLNIKKDSAKAFLPSTLSFRLCNAHKLYFNVVFKLLPYVALAKEASVFFCMGSHYCRLDVSTASSLSRKSREMHQMEARATRV